MEIHAGTPSLFPTYSEGRQNDICLRNCRAVRLHGGLARLIAAKSITQCSCLQAAAYLNRFSFPFRTFLAAHPGPKRPLGSPRFPPSITVSLVTKIYTPWSSQLLTTLDGLFFSSDGIEDKTLDWTGSLNRRTFRFSFFSFRPLWIHFSALAVLAAFFFSTWFTSDALPVFWRRQQVLRRREHRRASRPRRPPS